MRGRFLLTLLSLFIISSFVISHPAWVKQGVTSYYDGYAGNKKPGGGYSNPVQVRVINTIDSVDITGVQVTTTFQEVSSGIMLPPQTKKYKPEDQIGGFWADPAALNALKQGDKVGPFTVVGRGPLTIMNKQWDAIMIQYQEGEVRLTYVFDLSTGLLVSQTEIHGAQEVYAYFKSIEGVNLADYLYTPTAGNQPAIGGNTPGQNGNTQTGAAGGTQQGGQPGYGTGYQNPFGAGNNGTAPGMPVPDISSSGKQFGQVCGSLFGFIALFAALHIYRYD